MDRLVQVLERIFRDSGGACPDPLPFPMVVLCSNGIYFQRQRLVFIEKLEEATMFGRLPDLWPNPMPRIVGRLLRGVTHQTGVRIGSGAETMYEPGPQGITIVAAGDPVVRERCCKVLRSLDGWFEPAGHNSATRLEFDKALVNLTANLLGQIYAIDDKGGFTRLCIQEIVTPARAGEVRDLARQVFEVGRAVNAYGPDEQFEAVHAELQADIERLKSHVPSSLQWVELKLREGRLEPKLTPTEYCLLDPLVRYARSAGREETAEFFERLKDRLLHKLVLAAERQRGG